MVGVAADRALVERVDLLFIDLTLTLPLHFEIPIEDAVVNFSIRGYLAPLADIGVARRARLDVLGRRREFTTGLAGHSCQVLSSLDEHIGADHAAVFLGLPEPLLQLPHVNRVSAPQISSFF